MTKIMEMGQLWTRHSQLFSGGCLRDFYKVTLLNQLSWSEDLSRWDLRYTFQGAWVSSSDCDLKYFDIAFRYIWHSSSIWPLSQYKRPSDLDTQARGPPAYPPIQSLHCLILHGHFLDKSMGRALGLCRREATNPLALNATP